MDEAVRTCTYCTAPKPVSQFHKKGNGRISLCKECKNKKRRALYVRQRTAKKRYKEPKIKNIVEVFVGKSRTHAEDMRFAEKIFTKMAIEFFSEKIGHGTTENSQKAS